ncbi:MAG: hypothetical protein U0934_15360 [Pseudotabrizicola sp.]|nr:hypothetical protein [Pseudotabrizicola sp.]MDZ7575306.1 hypothetical protein [Pseudotabrizicola sp.]
MAFWSGAALAHLQLVFVRPEVLCPARGAAGPVEGMAGAGGGGGVCAGVRAAGAVARATTVIEAVLADAPLALVPALILGGTGSVLGASCANPHHRAEAARSA